MQAAADRGMDGANPTPASKLAVVTRNTKGTFIRGTGGVPTKP